jgi:ribonuclease P/MRP protein subunit POP1
MTGIGPRVIQVVDFASSRAPELQALHELSHDRYFDQDDMQRKVVDQKNQRRRRANAFNSYKMPLKLRLKSQNKRQKEQELIQVRGEQVDALSSNQKQREKLETSAHTMEKEKERCRKHRRRPHKLIAERAIGSTFVTDSSRVLRTHIWHAKRMKMEEKWGIVLPKHRADKSVSAALEVHTLSLKFSVCLSLQSLCF